MEKTQYKHKHFVFYLFTFILFGAGLFWGGCGIVAVMGTSTNYEKKVPAEFELAKHRDQKILVLVNQPGWLNAEVNLRYYLTEAINKKLIEKLKIPSKHLVAYSQLSEFRSNQRNFSSLSPVEVGGGLGADMVLLVTIADYQLRGMTEADYYKGHLNTETILIDVATGEKLWPKSAKSKSVKVGFEVERNGQQAAVKRLASACAYCMTRYFYDCPKKKFKIADDKSGVGWESWDK